MVVPMLEATKLEPKKSHATSIAIILPLSVISAVMYLINRVQVNMPTIWVIVPLGAIGAILGSFLLMKINSVWLKRIFGMIMIISAVRILLK